MKTTKKSLACWLLLVLIFTFAACGAAQDTENPENIINSPEPPHEIYANVQEVSFEALVARDYYVLPEPKLEGEMSVEEALQNRRSHRRFRDEALSAQQVSQLLWAAYGITLARPGGGLRTTPSAGATFPLEVYVVIGNVAEIYPGVFRYDSYNHILLRLQEGDIREELAAAALGQQSVAHAPMVIFYSAVRQRITEIYGDRGVRYAYMELGHSAQNVYLQAEALGLGTVAIGAFFDDRLGEIFGLGDEEVPLYLMPVGWIN